MAKKLRVALLGCGRAARYLHLPVLLGLPKVELTALAESDAQRRAEAARRVPGAQTYDDFSKLIDEADVEAAVVALPNPFHVPAAVAAFRRGLHVYVEKPLAGSIEEASGAVAAWRGTGRVGMIGYNYRFGPMHQEARRRIAEGEIGEVVAIQSVFATPVRELPEWKKRRATGGGALLDLASHHLDLACWFTGARPVAISCSLRSMKSDDDVATTQMEFEGGVIAQAMASIAAVEEDRFEIYGDRGKIVVDRYRSDRAEMHPATLKGVRLRRFRFAAGALASGGYWSRKFRSAGPEASFWRALGEFADAALDGRQAQPDLSDGLRCLIVLDAADRSAREGRRIQLGADLDACSAD